MKIFILLMAIAAAVLSGCGTAPPQTLTRVKAETAITGLAPLSVRAEPEVWDHVDSAIILGTQMPFRSGERFVSIFAGTATANPVMKIISSQLSYEIEDLGFTGHTHYEAIIEIKHGGQTQRFSASSDYRTHKMQLIPTQIAIAIDAVIADLAKQVSAAIMP